MSLIRKSLNYFGKTRFPAHALSFFREMSITPDLIRQKLIEEIGALHVEVEDTSPNRCAASFKVLIVSSQFEGKPLLQRHRMVNACLANELKEIHAFEQKTLTPDQWEKQKAA